MQIYMLFFRMVLKRGIGAEFGLRKRNDFSEKNRTIKRKRRNSAENAEVTKNLTKKKTKNPKKRRKKRSGIWPAEAERFCGPYRTKMRNYE